MTTLHRYIMACIIVCYFAFGLLVVWVGIASLTDLLAGLSGEGIKSVFATEYKNGPLEKITMALVLVVGGVIAMFASILLYSPEHKKRGVEMGIALAIGWVAITAVTGGGEALRDDWVTFIAGIAIAGYLFIKKEAIVHYEAEQLGSYLQKTYGEHRN